MDGSRILLNDFSRQWADTSADVLTAVERVGSSGWYVLGNEVDSFERRLANLMGRRQAVGCGNGLDAIEIALRALGLVRGAPVLTTPMSAFATTLAIVRAGGRPVFVDVDSQGLIDLNACESCLSSRPDIRFFVPVHLYGQAIDLSRVDVLRDRYELRIVEDCAQSFGASWQGRPVGSSGQAAALSFYPTKNLGALGDGGAVVTDDEEIRRLCVSLRNYGQSAQYQHVHMGMNSRLDEIQAAILSTACLSRLDRWTERRRNISQAYMLGIRNPNVTLVATRDTAASVWHLFPVRVEAALRDAFRHHLEQAGIQTGIHYSTLIPDQVALQSGDGFDVVGPLTNAKQLAGGELSIPVHPYLRDDEVSRVIEAVNSWNGA